MAIERDYTGDNRGDHHNKDCLGRFYFEQGQGTRNFIVVDTWVFVVGEVIPAS